MGLLSTFGAASGRAFGLTRVGAAIKDAYFNLVTLLLPGNGTNGAQNNTFLDSSSNNFTITRNGGNPGMTQGTFSPFSQTGWSNYFDTFTESYLTATGAASLGSGDFTVEAFIYPTATPNATYNTILSNYTTFSNTVILWYLNSTDKKIGFYANGTEIKTTNAISLNRWYHVAVVRNSGTITLYLDGVSQATLSYSGSASGNGNAYVGAAGDSPTTTDFTGYISNLRIVIGSPVYTSGFTPPTAPLTPVANTSLLTCQSNRFVDTNTQAAAKTITVNGTPSVQAFSPFLPTAAYSAATNGGSGYFDGSGDYLSVANNAAFDMGTGDFTVECWVYPTSVSGNKIYVTRAANSSSYPSFEIGLVAGALQFYTSSTGTSYNVNITSSITPKANAWNHIAATRSGSTFTIWVNGASGGTATSSASLVANSSALGIGAYPNGDNPNVGYFTNVRILKGTAQYTAAFTPPTAPLTAIANTQLLANFTNAGITDATAKNDLETVGNAQISTTQSKFGGSSMAFDGTGDWLTVIDNPNLQMGSGDFTIEGWFYLSATGVAYGIVSKGTSTTGWSVNITSGNKLQFSYTSSNLTGATTLSSATWYYFAVVRSGTATGNLKVYLNGSADATSAGAVTDNFNQTNIMYIGADRVGGSALNGYIDDLRITKGFARTITASPTAAFQLS